MQVCISILRGINVSGQKLIKMDTLRRLYENLGFQDVTTYLQSGNVIFTIGEGDGVPSGSFISGKIEQTFGFDVPVIVLGPETLKQIIDGNPFLADPSKDPSCMHVTFPASKPLNYDKDAIESRKQDGEEVVFSGDAVYLYCPHGYGRTKLNNNFLERQLNVVTTTRNWKTTTELLTLASQKLKAGS